MLKRMKQTGKVSQREKATKTDELNLIPRDPHGRRKGLIPAGTPVTHKSANIRYTEISK